MRVGIIGTAGRKDDGPRMSKQLYFAMVEKAWKSIQDQNVDESPIDLVSGGAAWADHVAVSLFLMGRGRSLHLYLPAPFDGEFAPTKDGRVANYYHGLFTLKMGGSTLDGIIKAIGRGATTTEMNGFLDRNHLVGQVDFLLAFTFGPHSYSGNVSAKTAGLKDGGTAHTWDHSSAPVKRHIHLPL